MTDRHIEIYKDRSGEWRWRRVAANGNITADSAEGYLHRTDCLEMAYSENPGVEVFDIIADEGQAEQAADGSENT